LRLRYQLRYRSHFGPQVEWSRRNITRDVTMATNQLHMRAGAANEEQLRGNLDYYRQLSEIAQGDCQLDIHYRLILVLAEGEVVLATSTDAEAG
jgi:hypothetical protein